MIDITELSARYNNNAPYVLDNVSLEIPAHRTMVLLGGSGSGKSTLLKCLMRLIRYQQGSISLDGHDIMEMNLIDLRRKIGMVFQSPSLFPHMTIRENIGIRLRLAGWHRTQLRERTEELMSMIGLEPNKYGDRYPNTLSGGQQQRVGVARAIATKPSYLLMDEPFGALDAITRRMLQEELKTLRARLNITILFVTHDIMEAVTLGEEVAVMDQGRIIQCGSINSLVNHPANETVRRMVAQPLQQMEALLHNDPSLNIPVNPVGAA